MSWKTIKAILSLDATAFESGVKRAESSMDRLSRKASGAFKAQLAGAFSVAAIGAFVHKVIEAGDRIKDMADVFGISTDEVQKLDIAAKRNAKSFEDLGKAMDKMGANREAAVQTNQKLLDAFNRLGISAAELGDENVRNLDLLKRIAEIAQSGNDSQRADALLVMGKGGAQLLATLEDLRTLGPVPLFRTQDLKAIEDLKDSIGLAGQYLLSKGAHAFGEMDGIARVRRNLSINAEIERRTGGGMWSAIAHKLFNTDTAKAAADAVAFQSLFPEGQGPNGSTASRAHFLGGEHATGPRDVTDAAKNRAIDLAIRSVDSVLRQKAPDDLTRLAPDQLQQVGGFVGLSGAIDPSISVQTSQLKVLEQIANILDNIGKGNQGAGQLPDKGGDAAFEP